MNTFAGNITLKGNNVISLKEFDYVENLSKDGNKVVFIFGETELKNSKEFLDMLEKKLGEIINYDLSISTEDKIEILNGTYEEGIYELASYEGEQVDFDEIIERFGDFEEVVSIREAEVSKRFGNKIVKVDFVY